MCRNTLYCNHSDINQYTITPKHFHWFDYPWQTSAAMFQDGHHRLPIRHSLFDFLSVCLIYLNDSIEAGWSIYVLTKSAIIGSNNGVSPVRRQAINSTNADSLAIGPLGIFMKFESRYNSFRWRKYIKKCCLLIVGHYVSASMCYCFRARHVSYLRLCPTK